MYAIGFIHYRTFGLFSGHVFGVSCIRFLAELSWRNGQSHANRFVNSMTSTFKVDLPNCAIFDRSTEVDKWTIRPSTYSSVQANTFYTIRSPQHSWIKTIYYMMTIICFIGGWIQHGTMSITARKQIFEMASLNCCHYKL